MIDKEITKELNRKLAEWVGFKDTGSRWYSPNGNKCITEPNFTQSLDACFKWLVPKVREQLGMLATEALLRKWLNSFLWRAEDPALALSWLIWEVVKK